MSQDIKRIAVALDNVARELAHLHQVVREEEKSSPFPTRDQYIAMARVEQARILDEIRDLQDKARLRFAKSSDVIVRYEPPTRWERFKVWFLRFFGGYQESGT